MFGTVGILESDGEKLRCHICGKWYVNLGKHVNATHGVTACEYKEEFGLNVGTSLIGEQLKLHKRNTQLNNKQLWERTFADGRKIMGDMRESGRLNYDRRHRHQRKIESPVSKETIIKMQTANKKYWTKENRRIQGERAKQTLTGRTAWWMVGKKQTEKQKEKVSETNRGEGNGSAKLTENDVIQIRKLRIEEMLTYKELSQRYNVSISLIELIVNKKIWKHI